jgi:hypothetical protein
MIFNVFLNCVIIFITCFVNSTLGFIYTHLFHGKLFSKNYFFKFFCVSLLLKKLVNEKYFPVKEKFSLVFKKVFFFYGKHFLKVIKNLDMLCYLLIISNLILKLLIVIYSILNFFSSILEFDLIWFLYQLWSLFLWLLFTFFLSLS